MAVRSHLIEHRCSVPWTLIAALIHLDQKRFRFSIPLCHPFVPGMAFGRKRSCVLIVLICLSLMWPLVALSQEIDEGEFSRTMLGYKLQLLKNRFEQTEMKLLTGSCAVSVRINWPSEGVQLSSCTRNSATLRPLKVEAGINGLHPTSWGPSNL
jgi:hypothetical protein